MLDAGNPYAVAFFSTLDFKAVYHSVMSVFLSWLSTQYPSMYPISAALYHHGQAIPLLRRRLTQGLHNDETYISILCAMQTEVSKIDIVHTAAELKIGLGINGQRECSNCPSEWPRNSFESYDR